MFKQIIIKIFFFNILKLKNCNKLIQNNIQYKIKMYVVK